jgi:hypothetical protein
VCAALTRRVGQHQPARFASQPRQPQSNAAAIAKGLVVLVFVALFLAFVSAVITHQLVDLPCHPRAVDRVQDGAGYAPPLNPWQENRFR